MLSASCHCGAVRIEIARRPRRVSASNGSICRRYGALWADYTPTSVRLVAKGGATNRYQWNRRPITFHFCARCGCITHDVRARSGGDTFAVDARNLPPGLLAALRVRRFDGAGTGACVD